jgi:hypothetical protein
MIPYNHLDKFNNRFAYFGSELDVVCVKLVFEFVIGTIILGFFQCAQVLYPF